MSFLQQMVERFGPPDGREVKNQNGIFAIRFFQSFALSSVQIKISVSTTSRIVAL
jgi:hypothetical protein